MNTTDNVSRIFYFIDRQTFFLIVREKKFRGPQKFQDYLMLKTPYLYVLVEFHILSTLSLHNLIERYGQRYCDCRTLLFKFDYQSYLYLFPLDLKLNRANAQSLKPTEGHLIMFTFENEPKLQFYCVN